MVDSLRDRPWYWGNADRTVVAQAMSTQDDGAFIVRDASVPGDFTLTVRFNGQTKLIRIHVHNGRCGFAPDALIHQSLIDLVEYHQTCSLKVYNELLDISLRHPVPRRQLQTIPSVVVPVTKTKRSSSNSRSEDRDNTGSTSSSCHSIAPSTSSLSPHAVPAPNKDPEWELRLGLERLRISQTAVDRCARLYDAVHAESQRAETLHHAYTKSLADLDKKTAKLEEIMETQATAFDDDSNTLKTQTLKANRRVLEKSVQKMKSEREVVVAERSRLLQVMEQLREESAQAKNRLVAGREVRDRAHKDLHERQVSCVQLSNTTLHSAEMLNKESMQVSLLLADLTLPWDPIQYLVNDSSKDAAAALILRTRTRLLSRGNKRSTDGIFLIRPSASHSNKLVLSVLNGDRVSHCLIEQNEQGWGFENGGLYFVTIGDFVRYYAHASLEEHNKDIRTVLTAPAL